MGLRMQHSKKEVKGDVLPCPFCGNEDLIISERKKYLELVEEHGDALIAIECLKCNVAMYMYDFKENHGSDYEMGVKKAIEKWNTRKEIKDGTEEDQ